MFKYNIVLKRNTFYVYVKTLNTIILLNFELNQVN